MCGRDRPNEAFSGKNHARHLCRECARLPAEVRDASHRFDDLWSMLFRQPNITPKNIGMASEWTASNDPKVAVLAQIVVDVGRIFPYRKHRMRKLRQHRPALWARMLAADVVDFDQLPRSAHEQESEQERSDEPTPRVELAGMEDPALSRTKTLQEVTIPFDDEIPF